jgi:putative DNA primase/helicase
MFANGNNARLYGDMTRRTVLSKLDPKLENPETRSFKYNPVKLIMDNRAAYIGAILTIAHAYLQSGDKVRCQPLASYGQWSTFVREPLLWLNEQDPIVSMEEMRNLDPVRNNARELIGYWKTYLQLNQSYTARQIIDEADRVSPTDGRYLRADFRDLLFGRCGERSIISSKKLANWLMSIRGQIHDGHMIELVQATTGHGNRYQLVSTQGSLPLEG